MAVTIIVGLAGQVQAGPAAWYHLQYRLDEVGFGAVGCPQITDWIGAGSVEVSPQRSKADQAEGYRNWHKSWRTPVAGATRRGARRPP